MLLFVPAGEGNLGRAAAVRDALIGYVGGVGLVDLNGMLHCRLGTQSRLEQVDRARVLLEGAVDAYRAVGVDHLVVVLPPTLLAEAPRLAFWAQRRAEDKAYVLPGSGVGGQGGQGGPLWHQAAQLATRLVTDGLAEFEVRPAAPSEPVIHTPRLVLAVPTPEQAEAYYHAIVGTEMFDTLIWDGPKDPGELVAWNIRARQEACRGPRHDLNLGIIDRATGVVMGGMGLRSAPRDPARVEIGYGLAPRFWGNGFATEAVRALVEFGFECRGAERIEAEVYVGNERSRRVLEKLGFQFEGTMTARTAKRGERRDGWIFGLTRAGWEALAAG